MNTSRSPGVVPATRPHSRAATSQTGSASKFGVFARYSMRTGKLRPSETSVSQGARYSRRAPVSRVADITTIRRSGRVVAWICLARASEMSPYRWRSWNSSKMRTLTPLREGSNDIRRSRIPSVTKRILVFSPARDSSRIWYPTVSPSGDPTSSATRRASIRVASLRGCRTTASPRSPSRPWRRSICGICVDFPEPVGACTIRRPDPRIAATIRASSS
jgi:hypothetical protein